MEIQRQREAFAYRIATNWVAAEDIPVEPNPDPFGFADQASQYDPTGAPGINHERHYVGDIPIDCLLHRDEQGKVTGILNYFPAGTPYEQPGSFTVMVDPKHQRKGIGTALTQEAMKRWKVNLFEQEYTPAGEALRDSIQRKITPRKKRRHASYYNVHLKLHDGTPDETIGADIYRDARGHADALARKHKLTLREKPRSPDQMGRGNTYLPAYRNGEWVGNVIIEKPEGLDANPFGPHASQYVYAASKYDEPKNAWYHATEVDLPVGSRLIPGTGTLSDNSVWVDDSRKNALYWARSLRDNGIHGPIFIYRVEPESEPEWVDPNEGYKTPSARITELVRTAANDDEDDDWEDFRDDTPWYGAAWDDEDDELPRKTSTFKTGKLLYHFTTPEAADEILGSGRMESTDESLPYHAFFTTDPNSEYAKGFGKSQVMVNIPDEYFDNSLFDGGEGWMDDSFDNGEEHWAIPLDYLERNPRWFQDPRKTSTLAEKLAAEYRTHDYITNVAEQLMDWYAHSPNKSLNSFMREYVVSQNDLNMARPYLEANGMGHILDENLIAASTFRKAMPWYHNTDAEFNSGDEILPASERGISSRWDEESSYDPSLVYFYQGPQKLSEDPNEDINAIDPPFGKNIYEVEPVGEIQRDPEWESNKRSYGGDYEYEADIPGYFDYAAPRARVIRKYHPDNWRQKPSKTSTFRTAAKAFFRAGDQPNTAMIDSDEGPLALLEWTKHDQEGIPPRPDVRQVEWINVHPMYRRQGLATSLFNWAKENLEPNLEHSRHVTPLGKAWARSMGFRPPKGVGWHMLRPNG